MTTDQVVDSVCHFEPVEPADLLSAVRSLTTRGGSYLLHEPIGAGFETFLDWSLKDIEAAANAKDSGDRLRYATNAIMTSRRCLSCVVDQYLLRDGISLCKDAPRDSGDKAAVLIKRGVLEPLEAEVLRRVVSKRAEAEHKYRTLDLEEAQDIVQIVRGTVDSITYRSSPYDGACLFGMPQYQHTSGPEGSRGKFFGWSDPLVAFMTFESNPWLGVIIPTSKENATVRQVSFSDVTVDQLLEVLSTVDKQREGLWSGHSADFFRDLGRDAGLLS